MRKERKAAKKQFKALEKVAQQLEVAEKPGKTLLEQTEVARRAEARLGELRKVQANMREWKQRYIDARRKLGELGDHPDPAENEDELEAAREARMEQKKIDKREQKAQLLQAMKDDAEQKRLAIEKRGEAVTYDKVIEVRKGDDDLPGISPWRRAGNQLKSLQGRK